MSIIKNNISASDTHVTIRTFKELVDSGYTYEVKKSFNYVAQHDEIGCYPTDRCTIQILCDIPNESGNNGYFFGQHVSGGYLSVQKDGDTIKYYRGNGTTPVATHAYETGFHQYGFVNGIPVYDNQALTDAPTGDEAALAEHWISIGRANNANVIPKINVQRVNILAGVGGQFKEQAAYYPIVDSEDSTYMIWFEARQRRQNTQYLPEWIETHARAFTNFNNDNESNGYGVQLDDLRTVFGSGYRDLMAIITQDGGVDTDCGWVATSEIENDPRVAQQPYQYSGRNFAFSLKGISISTTKGGTPQIGPADVDGRDAGVLKKGRKPKWNIWNDAIGWGFYVINTNISGPKSADRFKLQFAFQMDNTRTRMKDNLYVFNGYNTDGSHSHKPYFVMLPAALTVDFHNGVFVICRDDNRIIGRSSGVIDSNAVYVYTEMASTSPDPEQPTLRSGFRLGNLPLWNKSTSEQTTAPSPYESYISYGGGIILKWKDGNEWKQLASLVKIAQNAGGENVILASDSPTEVKNLFRDAYNEVDGYINTEFIQELRAFAIRNISGGTWPSVVNTMASLVLLKEPKLNPESNEVIDCSDFVPDRKSDIALTYDNAVHPGSGDNVSTTSRIVIRNPQAKMTVHYSNADIDCDICMSTNVRSTGYDYLKNVLLQPLGTQEQWRGIGFPYAIANPLMASLTAGIDKTTAVMAYVEYTEADSFTGIINKVLRGFIKSRAYLPSEWAQPSAYQAPWNASKYWNFAGESGDFEIRQSSSYDIGSRMAVIRYMHDFYNESNLVQPDTNGTAMITFSPLYTYGQGVSPWSSDKRPHAWDVSRYQEVALIDNVSECQYLGSSNRFHVFVNNDRLINTDVTSASDTLLVNGYYSIWNKVNDITATRIEDTSEVAVPVRIVRQKLVDCHTERTGDNADVLINFGQVTPGTPKTVDGYTCSITPNVTYDGFTVLPDGTYGKGMNKFYQIRITGPTSPGEIYRLLFS